METTMPGPMEIGLIFLLVIPMMIVGALITVIPFWKIVTVRRGTSVRLLPDRDNAALRWRGVDRWQQADSTEHGPRVAGSGRGPLSSGGSQGSPRLSIAVGKGSPFVELTLGGRGQTCGLDPFAYLRDVLTRISTHPASRIAELLPRNWKPAGL